MTALAGAAVRRSSRAVALAAIALAAGSLGPAAWPSAAKAQPQEPAEQVFDLRIEGGEVDGIRTLRVWQDDRVRLRFTADAPTILHLHGYDIEQEVAPGRAMEMSFEAYATGRFALEIHGSDLAHHEAPLLILEVYPR